MMKLPFNPGWYVLKNREPVPVDDMMTWALFFENTKDRIVAQESVGPIFVSTVFLGLDHNFFGNGPPLLFETMIFGADASSYWTETYCRRYSTWKQAEDGHTDAVDAALEVYAKAQALLKTKPKRKANGGRKQDSRTDRKSSPAGKRSAKGDQQPN